MSTPAEHHGILYLLDGTKLGARLVVSVATLRRHYRGRVAVLTTDPSAYAIGNELAGDRRLDVEHVHVVADPWIREHRGYVLKTIVHRYTPFDVSVFLDCDTIVRGDLSPLFDLPTDEHVVVTQFCDWTTRGARISSRIRQWSEICSDLIEPALAYGRAVNTGVFAFGRQRDVLERWFTLAYAGRARFIPDEVAMQLLLPHIPHVMLDARFNCSAKYGQPDDPDVRIVHFHGRKHVGPYGMPWLIEYERAFQQNLANLRSWTPATDNQLRSYLAAQRACR
jgi:hypothetical protein